MRRRAPLEFSWRRAASGAGEVDRAALPSLPFRFHVCQRYFPTLLLVFKDIYIPGEADLEILIPSGKGTPTIHSYNNEKSLSQLPTESLS